MRRPSASARPTRGVGLGLLRPLHFSSPSWPRWLQSIIAPVQALHLRSINLPRDASALEAALRPRLLPTEDWRDTHGWRENVRLLAFMRSAYLLAEPATRRLLPPAEAALAAYPQKLPSAALVRQLFERSHPDGSWPPPAAATSDAMHPNDPLPHEGSTRDASFGEVLHRCGGLVRGRGALNVWCEANGECRPRALSLLAARPIARHVIKCDGLLTRER